jgi:hypothetical protein
MERFLLYKMGPKCAEYFAGEHPRTLVPLFSASKHLALTFPAAAVSVWIDVLFTRSGIRVLAEPVDVPDKTKRKHIASHLTVMLRDDKLRPEPLEARPNWRVF